MLEKVLSTPVGTLRLMAEGGCLIYCNWEEEKCLRKLQKIRNILTTIAFEDQGENFTNESVLNESVLEETERQLLEYFEGRRTFFEIPLKTFPTPFQRSVWSHLLEIAYGTRKSYGEIGRALSLKGAARAIANACGANPIAIIIPCHRVIAADGKTGGYTGGIEKKLALLSLESGRDL